MTAPTTVKANIGHSLLFVTGTRADYGKLEPLALAAQTAGFEVTFFVTGMHMLERYGLTKEEVHGRKCFKVIEFINQRYGDPQDVVLCKTISYFSDLLKEHKYDLVVVHGDRVEALACALVCATNYVRCAHIEGGEVSGSIDELFRHSVTKLANIHLVSSPAARERVIRLGEIPRSVFVIGSPELDAHSAEINITLDDVLQRYDIQTNNYGICVFHPVTSEIATLGEQAEAFFESLASSGRYFVVILPNNDPGADLILAVIDKLPRSQFRVLPSMRFHYFSKLMRCARVIVGNSSIGVREAPFLGVPSLNIGTRQSSRAQSLAVQNCDAFDRANIEIFLSQNWGRRFERSHSFGRGKASTAFVQILKDEGIWALSFQKHFSD